MKVGPLKRKFKSILSKLSIAFSEVSQLSICLVFLEVEICSFMQDQQNPLRNPNHEAKKHY